MLTKVVLAEAFDRLSDAWSPEVAGDVNDMQVKLAEFEGGFVWHAHEGEDELFLGVAGRLRIDLRDGDVDLGPGELVVIPRGTEHRPVALPTAHVVLFEPSATVNTGEADDARRVIDLDRIEDI